MQVECNGQAFLVTSLEQICETKGVGKNLELYNSKRKDVECTYTRFSDLMEFKMFAIWVRM